MALSNRLTVVGIKSLKPGLHADGNGLYVRVKSEPVKEPDAKPKGRPASWVFIYQWQGKRREMGLGPYGPLQLAEARTKAAEAAALVRAGVDPLSERNRPKTAGITFGEVANEFIATKGEGWRNPKHRQQWSNTLRDYAGSLMDMPVCAITMSDVLACLKPIWGKKPETASRVRGRIENVLSAAKARGYRSGENPAAWKDNLAHWLPPPKKLTRGHQRALDYQAAPEFMKSLRQRSGVAAMALEFTVLNAVRTSETRKAVWSEIDWEGRVWNVPAERTKTKKLLRVALSNEALAILKEMQMLGSDWVFPSTKLDKPLSANAMLAVLKRMGADIDTTVHGFRSTFSDWAGETTDFPRDIVEMALGHAVGNAVERAYRRGDALDRRRSVMDAWAAYLAQNAK
ncbi:tyrosine-type recombinase/integrase [Brevundimonas sp.]